MKEIILFFFLLGIIFVISGYLEMYFDNKNTETKTEYRFVPRNVYDTIGSNIDNQFDYIFDVGDARNKSNLI
jgi:hypothetical protein